MLSESSVSNKDLSRSQMSFNDGTNVEIYGIKVSHEK